MTVSEPDPFDALLRDSLSAKARPQLTPNFTERVTSRLRPRRLGARARRTLWVYTVVAVGTCVVVMRALGVEWSLVAGSLAVTVTVGAIVRARLG
jgi:hypothetical protein